MVYSDIILNITKPKQTKITNNNRNKDGTIILPTSYFFNKKVQKLVKS